MEKQFVPYKLAVKLKELGFDEECLTCYCNHWKDLQPYLWDVNQPDYGEYWDLNSKVYAPLWQQAFDWLLGQINNNYKLLIGTLFITLEFNINENYYKINAQTKEELLEEIIIKLNQHEIIKSKKHKNS